MNAERLLSLASNDDWMSEGFSHLDRYFPIKQRKRDSNAIRKLDVEKSVEQIRSQVSALADAIGSDDAACALGCGAVLCLGVEKSMDLVREHLFSATATPRQSSIGQCVRLYGELEGVKSLLLESFADIPGIVAGRADALPYLSQRAMSAAKAGFVLVERYASLLPFLLLEETSARKASAAEGGDGASVEDSMKRERRMMQNVAALVAIGRSVLGENLTGAAVTERLMDRLGVAPN